MNAVLFSGTLCLSRRVDICRVIDQFKAGLTECKFQITTDRGAYLLKVFGFGENNSRIIRSFLHETTPCTRYGSISYQCSDGAEWKHRFESDNERWVEEQLTCSKHDSKKEMPDCVSLLDWRNSQPAHKPVIINHTIVICIESEDEA